MDKRSIVETVSERERRALSMTTPGRAPSPQYMHEATVYRSDESQAGLHSVYGSMTYWPASLYAGKIEFRRTDADRKPPREVVTALVCGDPLPGQLISYFATNEEILSHNAIVKAQRDAERAAQLQAAKP